MPSLHKVVTFMSMKKKVNNGVSRDSNTDYCFLVVVLIMLYKVIRTFSLSNRQFSLLLFADQGRSCDCSSRPGS